MTADRRSSYDDTIQEVQRMVVQTRMTDRLDEIAQQLGFGADPDISPSGGIA